MIYILCDSKFRESVWCKMILNGIEDSLKKKRRKYSVVDSIDGSLLSSECGVFLVGSNDKWINSKVELCNTAEIIPIVVCNQRGRICKGMYHGVSADIEYIMEQICSFLTLHNCSNAVFYGLNEASASDRGKAEYFTKYFGENSVIIENNGSLEDAYSRFEKHSDTVDAVVCANDFFAVHLVKKLLENNPKLLSRLKIVSSVKTKLSFLYEKYIVSFETDFELIGKTASELYEFIVDKPFLSGITVNVRCKSFTEDGVINSIEHHEAFLDNDAFYQDREIVEALKVDNLINDCKGDDFDILKLLCAGKTYSQIAEACYMSESNVKYHVKKYIETLGIKNREELQAVLSEYII